MLQFLIRYGPIGSFLAPILLFGYSYFVAPKYYAPLFSDPFGVWLVVGMLIWDGVGLGLSFAFPSTVMRILVFLLVTIPLFFADCLAPATLTIGKAVSPLMR